MKKKEYIKINTLQMHYFLEVADNGSFTNAAKQLYTTQSTLSKTILSLEETLGITLFVRSHKRLILTEAGKYLYNRWRALLTDIDHSIEECRILQGGYANMLSIGVLESHNPKLFSLPHIHTFSEKNPKINLSIQIYSAQELRQRVLSGRLDLAYTVLYDVEQLKVDELDFIILNKCPHNVGMLSTNPLAQKEYLEISDLENSNFVSISPLYTPSYNGMVDDLCKTAGFKPNYVRYTNNATSQPYNLVSDNDIFICDRNYWGYEQPSLHGIQFRPLIHTQSGMVVIWRKNNVKPELLHFIDEINVNLAT